jgi:DNA-binding NarL/FixJ family response regulator
MRPAQTRLMCLLHCRVCADSFRAWCDSESEFQLIEASPSEVWELAAITEHRPEILVLDLDRQEDVLCLAAQVRVRDPSIRIAVLGAKWSDLILSKAAALRVDGLLLNNESTDALFEHLRFIADGQERHSPDLQKRLKYNARENRYVVAGGSPLSALSGLQLEIVRLLACGDSLKMVASKLQLSRKAIDGQKYRLMRKLGVKDRVLLSRLAIREGLIQA